MVFFNAECLDKAPFFENNAHLITIAVTLKLVSSF